MKTFAYWIGSAMAAFALVATASAQELTTLKMSVEPKEAYTFIDGNAMGTGNKIFDLTVGAHKVVVANYGYKFFEKEVSLDSGKPSTLKVTLERSGPEV